MLSVIVKQLSLDVLRTFISIIDYGGFAKAGAILGRSQPAISLQIKRLEAQLKLTLFRKQGQRHQLTTEGQWLSQYARQLLALNDELFAQLGQQQLSGRLRLGIPSEFASTILPSIIGEFAQQYPDVILEVTSALSRELLAENQQDFDLVLALLPPHESTDAEVIRVDEMVWVTDESYTPDFKPLKLVLAQQGCRYRSRVIECLKQQTEQWKITYSNSDLYGLRAAMQQGLGITALAKSALPDGVKVLNHRKLPKLGQINICLFNFDTEHPEISQALSGFIKARLGN